MRVLVFLQAFLGLVVVVGSSASQCKVPHFEGDRAKMVKYILVGNPGVGKSSTVNSYVRDILFTAGPSTDGSGVTACLDIKKFGNTVFMDTPGLNDIDKRKEAALEIERALKEPGEYRLIFMISPESGRVKPDDLTTIKLVLDALNSVEEQVKDDMYSILVNKVQPSLLEKLQADPEQVWMRKLINGLRQRGCPVTKRIHLGQFINSLADKTDALADLPGDTRKFLDEAITIRIDGVGTIDAESFEEQQQKAAEAEIRAQKAEDKAKEAETAKDEEQRKRLKEEAKAQQAEMDRIAAVEQHRLAEQRASRAEQQRRIAEKQKRKADQTSADAHAQREAAERREAAEKQKAAQAQAAANAEKEKAAQEKQRAAAAQAAAVAQEKQRAAAAQAAANALRNQGQECYYHCNPGKCSYCGTEGYCCRQDWSGCPLKKMGCHGYHCCTSY